MYYDPVQRKLDKLDERISQLNNEDKAFQLGVLHGCLYQMQLEQWYKGVIKEEPVRPKHTDEYYLMRHLIKQYKLIVKQRK